MAQTDEIAHVVASVVQPTLGDFRYFKSYTQARRQTDGIVDDIIFSVTTPGSGNPYTLYLYFGVQHRNVETVVAAIHGRKLNAYARTIFQNSCNISPTRDMRFDGESAWEGLRSPSDVHEISRSLTRFIAEFVLPYHTRFHDLSVAREHLARHDGWVLNHTPYEQVLVIDALAGATDRAASYLEGLQRERAAGYRWDPVAFNQFYRSLRSSFGTLPTFTLS